MSETQKAITTGVTVNTPDRLFVGPGTIHNGLKYDYTYTATSDVTAQSGKTYYTKSGNVYTVANVETGDTLSSTYYERGAGAWNFSESLIGATNGLKISIKPNIKEVKADGMLVKVKGMFLKRGEEAKIEGSIIELTPGLIKQCIFADEADESDVDGYTLIESRETIEEGDYYTDFAYVGALKDGTPVIILFDYAICTSGLEVEGKNDDNATIKVTIECCAAAGSELNKLPYHIYYPEDDE